VIHDRISGCDQNYGHPLFEEKNNMTKRPTPREIQAVYVISVAAGLAGMHPQTLRIYERRGLIEPFRTPGGTRRYSDEDLARLGLIQELTEQGINLEGVKRIMALEHENEKLRIAVSRLRKKVSVAEEITAAAVREVHRSSRADILVRRDVLGNRLQ
jgi:MerR family transcriptional regulator/heat shock protein HspR